MIVPLVLFVIAIPVVIFIISKMTYEGRKHYGAIFFYIIIIIVINLCMKNAMDPIVKYQLCETDECKLQLNKEYFPQYYRKCEKFGGELLDFNVETAFKQGYVICKINGEVKQFVI